jgi:hypothetical protein
VLGRLLHLTSDRLPTLVTSWRFSYCPNRCSFADAKQLHGHRYARMRGRRRAAEQCLLAAAAQNMKKIALLLSRTKPNPSPNTPDSVFITQLQQQLRFLAQTFCWIQALDRNP